MEIFSLGLSVLLFSGSFLLSKYRLPLWPRSASSETFLLVARMKHVSRSQHKIYPSPWLNSHARLFLLFRERGSLGIFPPQFRFAYDIPRGVRKLGRGSVRWLTEFGGTDESYETRSRPPKTRRERSTICCISLYRFVPFPHP